MELNTKLTLSRQLTLASYFGLLLFYTLRYLWIAPAASSHPWVIWLVYSVPLLAFAPAVLRGTPRPHAWLCFVLLLYFLGAVLTAIQPKLALLGVIEALLLVVLFCAAMLYARWKSQWLRHTAQ